MALDDLSAGAFTVARPRRRRLVRIVAVPLIFLFRLLTRVLAALARLVGAHPASSGIVLVLVAGVAFLGYQDYGNPTRATSGAGLVPARSVAAENFIKGQTTFDATLMWQGLSSSLKQTLTQQGTSVKTLQAQLDQRKQAGAKVEGASFGGGVTEPNGSRVYLYVITMDVPGSQSPVSQTYVLTVDTTDKITQVE
ncbi:MAG TPA: hypothetical protein VMV93_06275 [Chloroflexota bacterium]|nr:hypothetical protein [Chloroflexota bacterium]